MRYKLIRKKVLKLCEPLNKSKANKSKLAVVYYHNFSTRRQRGEVTWFNSLQCKWSCQTLFFFLGTQINFILNLLLFYTKGKAWIQKGQWRIQRGLNRHRTKQMSLHPLVKFSKNLKQECRSRDSIPPVKLPDSINQLYSMPKIRLKSIW